jgi:hypothetical protein
LPGWRLRGSTSSRIIFPIKSRLSSNPLIVLVCSSSNPHDQNCQSSSPGTSKWSRPDGFAASAGTILCGAVGKTRSIPTRSNAFRNPFAFLAKLGPVYTPSQSPKLCYGGGNLSEAVEDEDFVSCCHGGCGISRETWSPTCDHTQNIFLILAMGSESRDQHRVYLLPIRWHGFVPASAARAPHFPATSGPACG